MVTEGMVPEGYDIPGDDLGLRFQKLIIDLRNPHGSGL